MHGFGADVAVSVVFSGKAVDGNRSTRVAKSWMELVQFHQPTSDWPTRWGFHRSISKSHPSHCVAPLFGSIRSTHSKQFR